jgi:hypothetical protein
MKLFLKATVIAAVALIPALSFAQSSAPVTRAQVRADLVQFEQNAPRGALGHDPYYPVSTQAAETRIAQENSNSVAVGGTSNGGTSAAGSRLAPAPGAKPLYFGE